VIQVTNQLATVLVVVMRGLRKRCACKSENETARMFDNDVEREKMSVLVTLVRTARSVLFQVRLELKSDDR